MNARIISGAAVEKTALDWQTAFGSDISPDLPAPGSSRQAGCTACERQDYNQVVLIRRLQIALANINPNIPPDGGKFHEEAGF
jgi:hypothetical protein